jgi:segregation and condensation protein B
MIFASDEPVRPQEIGEALGGIDPAAVEEAIRDLGRHFDHSAVGLRVEWIAGGVRLATRPEVAPWVRQFFRQRNRTRLSVAALETLAIVAYRQPATAPEVQAIRGKDPVAALKGLLDKKLIRILGRKKVVGSPLLYGTTKEFLHHFGLNSLEDLPSIEDFDPLIGALGDPAGLLATVSAEDGGAAAAEGAPEEPGDA